MASVTDQKKLPELPEMHVDYFFFLTRMKIFPYEHSSPGWYSNFPPQKYAKLGFFRKETRVNKANSFVC